MASNTMKHAFDTQRLRVFKSEVTPTDHNTERTLYVAFRTDEDRPMVCATALIDASQPMQAMLGGAYVDWVEVTSEYRRKGFAGELLRAVEKDCGAELVMDPGSDDGEGLCDWWDRTPAQGAGGGEPE